MIAHWNRRLFIATMYNMASNESRPDANSVLPKGIAGKCSESIKYLFQKQPDAISALKKTLTPPLDITETARLSEIMPKVFSALFGIQHGFVEKSADTNDFSLVSSAITERIIGPKKTFDDIAISIGLGGALDVPNIRIASYILPALSSLDEMYNLHQSGKIRGVARLVVFKADHMATHVNHFNQEQVRAVSEVTFNFLREFVDTFFPHLPEYISFEHDFDIKSPEAKPILEKIESYASWLLTHNPDNPTIRKLVQMGKKHGGEEGKRQALLYAAAHAFYQGSLPDIISTPIASLKNPSVLIVHGGQPQSVFNEMSRLIIDEERLRGNTTVPTVGLITKVGKRPPYYAARDGDIPIGTDLATFSGPIDETTQPDYEILYSRIPRTDFEDFVKEFNRKHSAAITSMQNKKL